MNVTRQVSIPVVISICFLTLLSAALSFFVSLSFYHHYHHIGTLPAFSAVFERVLPAAWLLPLLAIVFGIVLIRRPNRSAVSLAWYCASAAILNGIWVAATLVALLLMHVCFNHYL